MAVLAQAPAGGSFAGPQVQWFALSPILVLLGGALVLLLASALARRQPWKGTWAFVTVASASAALVLSWFLWDDVRDAGALSLVGGAMGLDGFSVFVTMAICAGTVLAALFVNDYVERESLSEGPEIFSLLLLCGAGGVVMAGANDLIVLFLGLESLAIGQYVLAASHSRRAAGQESALKYFVLGGFSSAFLLYGIAMVYGATGTTNLARIADFLRDNVLLDDGLLLAGLALMLVGLGFKVSAAPFHAWTPDVYEGAPSPVTGFMASAAKAAAFAALLRVFSVAFGSYLDDWRPALWALAALTLVVGSVAAAVQTNVKRMLAYSSISHAGYVLVAIQAGTFEGTSAALFYVMAYTFMVLGSFGVITVVGRAGDDRHDLSDYRGLARRKPLLALVFTIFLLAQAGVPLTAGFFAKFYVIAAAVDRADTAGYVIAVLAMLAAVVAAFLYLRIIVAMYLGDSAEDAEGLETVAVPVSSGLALALALAFTLVVGFLPSLVVDLARDAVPVLVAAP